MRAGAELGQATSEYLMIVGLMTSVFLVLSGSTERPFRAMMRDLLQCIADGTINQIPCEQATSVRVQAVTTPPSSPDGVRSTLLQTLRGQGSPASSAGTGGDATGGSSASRAGSGSAPPGSPVPNISSVQTSVEYERFNGRDGRSHQTARICTSQTGALQQIARSDGSVFLVAEIESAERPQVGGGLRVPVAEIGPGRWRMQYQVSEFELSGGTFCMPVTDVQGDSTRVTSSRFVTEPEI